MNFSAKKNWKHNFYFSLCFIFAIVFSSLIFTSCKQNAKSASSELAAKTVETISTKPKSHEWFYFTSNSFAKTSRPQSSPSVQTKPWTEAVRISSASSASAEDGKTQKAYMIVNRMGVLCLDDADMELCKDQTLFSDRTAGNLVFLNGEPLFSIYKSAFFNDPTKDNQHPFLVHFDSASKIAYPLINCDNLTQKKSCEIVDFIWDGTTWHCCIKSEENEKNEFTYIKWSSQIPLLSQSPVLASDNVIIEESVVDSFRKEHEPLSFSKAPERIKKLLNGVPSSVPFNLTVHTAGGTSPRIYSNVPKEDESSLSAYGIISQTWSGILFQDGTLYLEGALDGRRIVRGGKPVAIRLPKIPYGYIYPSFIITGTTLYAAWEESDFYKTGRSGFIKVNLDETLYRDIIRY